MLHDSLIREILSLKDRNGAETTTVDEVMEIHNVERAVAVDALKKLADRKLGEFKVGRGASGDFKTRIEWANKHDERSDGRNSLAFTQTRTLAEQRSPRTFKIYEFTLDQTRDIKLELPRDLTANEAERIAQFVRSLVSL